MKIAYFDCFAGASGDMILGALMDAGLPVEVLKKELDKLHLSHFDLQVKKVLKKGIGGSQALVILEEDHHHEDHHQHHHEDHHHHHEDHQHHHEDHQHHHEDHHHHHEDHHEDHHHHEEDVHCQHQHQHHRQLYDIKEIIEKSDLEEVVKERSIKIFTRLAQAEAKVHQTSIENIHFHEVGAMDAIIDVVGAVAGFAVMGIERIYCSPLHVGSGTVECAHGTLPVPAPAAAELLIGKPIYSTDVQGELVTPTGAAILTTLCSDFGPMPAMKVEKIGYGAGTAEPAIPNLLRVCIGEASDEIRGYETERVAVIETSIDDMNPQIYDYLTWKLLDMGVMDTFLTWLQMKKNRPGTLLTVISQPDMVEKIADFLIRETTSIGLRWRVENRIKAHRSIKEAPTRYGPIRFKAAKVGNEIVNLSPEYEDCKRVAIEKNVPLKDVMEEVRRTIYEEEKK